MYLADLPVEIIENILVHLPRHVKQQCLLVCKSWYHMTLPDFNRYIQLLGSQDVLILHRKMGLQQVPAIATIIHGSDIRCLSLTIEKASDRHIVRKNVLVHILNACTHLQTLQLMRGSNQFLEYMYQRRLELHVDALQTIYIPFNAINRIIKEKEFRAILHHCQKITQMTININRGDIVMRDGRDNMNLGSYLNKFTRLQTLSIHFDNVLVLHDIVSACPQLESLRLFAVRVAPSVKLQVYKTDNSTNNSINNPSRKPMLPVKSQLLTLVVEAGLFSKDLPGYLSLHTKNLYQMTFRGTISRSTQQIIDALTTYSINKEQNALNVKSICFDNHLACSDKLMQQIKSSFSSSLRRLNLMQCDFSNFRDEHNNLMLDLAGLNLDYLIFDIQNLFENRIANLNKTSLEVTINDNTIPKTVCYQRKSKWKPGNLFVLKDSKQYTNQAARDKRLKSDHTCVLTIMADSIHHMRLHCQSQDNRHFFNQIINFKA